MSVRGERVIYKERERDTWEEQPRKTYTTIKRYQVPDSSSHSHHSHSHSNSRSAFRLDDEEDVTEDKIIIKRETRRESSPPARERDDTLKVTERVRERSRTPGHGEEVDFRFTERRTERSRDPPRRDVSYRVVERETDYDRPTVTRSVVRAPSPPSPERVREWRFERERDFSPPYRAEPEYEVERYSKSTEYYAQPQPQPIVIRESTPQPIIIREERREPQKIIIRREEPQYEFVEREEVKEEKSLVKHEEPPPPAPVPPPASEATTKKEQEEDYFYERRVIERNRRRSDSHERKTEIRPRDSASQYSSDDSYEYVRRERTYEDERDRDHSPHHKRHLAEGALAGVAAGQILRHHKKQQGEKAPGRGRSIIGGAALGAVGAEAISRVRSMSRRHSRDRDRSRSRSRSRSGSARGHRRRKHRSRSRSKSLTRVQQLGGLAAVAAVAGLAGYALNKRSNNKETIVVNDRPHRSRSRRRRHSVDTYDNPEERGRESLDPSHRNRRIAQAGLASAAAAGIWERVRSKSRGAKGGKGKSRERSRIQQGVPIAAAGLGGAALAGLYEKNKANKEAKKEAIIEDELNRGRRRRSRSRSRSVPASRYDDDRRDRDMDDRDRGLIAYGNEPIHPEAQRDYYSEDEPGNYRRRHGGGSEGSSPDTRRRRSRSRSRPGWSEAGAGAGLGALAAHEYGRRNQPRQDDYAQPPYGPARDMYSPPPVGQNSYGGQPAYQSAYQPTQSYPGGNYFPPPPTGGPAAGPEPYPAAGAQNPYPAYNPADYVEYPNQPQQAPHSANMPAYGYGNADASAGAPQPRSAPNDDGYGHGDQAGGKGTGRDPENVSAPTGSPEEEEEHGPQDADGVDSSARPRSTSRVKFDTSRNTEHSPETTRQDAPAEREVSSPTRDEAADDEDDAGHGHRRRRRKHRDRNEGHRDSPQLMHDKYDRSPVEDGSVEELPARFDEHGNRKGESGDPLADQINALLEGGGGLGGIFRSLSGRGSQGDDDGGRRRRR